LEPSFIEWHECHAKHRFSFCAASELEQSIRCAANNDPTTPIQSSYATNQTDATDTPDHNNQFKQPVRLLTVPEAMFNSRRILLNQIFSIYLVLSFELIFQFYSACQSSKNVA
jgi:hypothetical protein